MPRAQFIGQLRLWRPRIRVATHGPLTTRDLDTLLKKLAELVEHQHKITFKLTELLQSNANRVDPVLIVFDQDQHTQIVNLTKPGCGYVSQDSSQKNPTAATKLKRLQTSRLVASTNSEVGGPNNSLPLGNNNRVGNGRNSECGATTSSGHHSLIRL